MENSAGLQFKQALKAECPLQIVGVINAMSALLAKQAGFKAVYLSGAGVASACFGLPDLGLTSLNDICEETRRMSDVSDLPILVDADTGFGGTLNVARTVKQLIRAGAAALHIEDQAFIKKCGHRTNKQIVSTKTMVDRIKAAVDAREDSNFIIIARTDALKNEGLHAAIERSKAYVASGADIIFAEAVTTLEEYQMFVQSLSVPVLANITEFGQTPLFTVKELKEAGIKLILYPLSAFRVMNKAALLSYEIIRKEGSQQSLLDKMQTREELYQLINYYRYEAILDKDDIG